MADKIEATVAPIDFKLSAGENAEVIATLRNLGETVDQLTLQVEDLAPDWYTIPVSSVALFPKDQDNLRINLNPPPTDETKSGLYPFRIVVTSQEYPEETITVDLTIEIRAVPGLEVTISPQSITGRKGVYKIAVGNMGDSEVTLGLKASDAQGVLRYNLRPKSLKVPGSGNSGSTLEARLGWKALFGGAKEFDFEVLVESPDAEETKTVNGQLVRLPWYKILTQIRLPRIQLPWLARPPAINAFAATTDDKREFKLSWSVKRATEVKLNDEDVDLQGERRANPTEATIYVLTASNKYGSSSRTVEVQPLPPPSTEFTKRIGVSLSPSELQAGAGGVPVTATLKVKNLGEIVDRFLVEIDGLGETWYSCSTSEIALMPEATDQTQISFHPPNTKGVKAKVYPFAVTMRSQSNLEEASSVAGQIDVLPSEGFKLGVHPYRIFCRRKGSYRINLNNTGVSDINFALEATDLDEGLQFHFKNTNPAVGAWDMSEIPLVARPRKGSILGGKKRYDITITATTDNGISQSTQCELNHNPFIGSWRSILSAVKKAIALAVIFAVLYSLLQFGGGWGMLRSSPQAWSQQLLYTIQSWFMR